MAIGQIRVNGDVAGVVDVDTGVHGTAAGIVVNSGNTKAPTFLKIVPGNTQSFTGESAVGGAVETILRLIGQDSTIVMYQNDGTQLSVMLEATGAATPIATTIATRIAAVGANIGVAGNVWAGPGVTVTTSGFKLA
jgi:hypothetical protein